MCIDHCTFWRQCSECCHHTTCILCRNLVFWKNTVWLKKGLILFWKEDCTSSERNTACLEVCSIIWRDTVLFLERSNALSWKKTAADEWNLFCEARKGMLQHIGFLQDMTCCVFWPEYVLLSLRVIVCTYFVLAKGCQQVLPLWN